MFTNFPPNPMPRPLPIFCPFLPALDEWKLEAAMTEAGFPAKVSRYDRTTVKVTPAGETVPDAVKAFAAGWVAGSLSY